MLEIEPDAYFYLKPKSADSPSQGTSASVADVSSSLQPPPEAILPDAAGAVSKNMYLSAAYFPWFIIEGDEDAKFYATTHEKTSCFCITWEDLNMKLSKNGIQVSQETPYRDFTPDEKTIARLDFPGDLTVTTLITQSLLSERGPQSQREPLGTIVIQKIVQGTTGMILWMC